MEKSNVVKTVGDAIWHRRLLIGAILAVVMVAGAAIYSVTPPTYEAQAQVYVDPSADQALQQGEGLLIRDIAQQATSRRVLARAGQQLAGSPTPEQLAPRITAAVVQAPNLVVVSASAGSPASAAELANAVAVAVVGQHRANSTQRGLQSQTYLTGELARLAGVLKADQAAGASIDQQNLDRQEYSNTYTRLQDLQLRLTRAAESVSVSQQALAPDRPVNPDLARYLGVAAAAGIFIALLVALLVERFDDRVFDSETVANVSGASLVVVTPSSRRAQADELPAQFTLAYAHITARYPSARTIMVAASSHREATDPVAAAFGDAAELAGDRAIVLQREPSPNPAHTNVSKSPWRWPVLSRSGTELAMMTEVAAGPTTLTLPALAIASPEHAASAALDAPPLTTFVAVPAPFLNPKAASLSNVADVAIVVAIARATRMAEVARTAECLRQVGVEPVAVILVHKQSAGQSSARTNGNKWSGLAGSITIRPADVVNGSQDRQRQSVTTTRDATEAISTEATVTEVIRTEAFPTEAAPTEAVPTEAVWTEANVAEVIPVETVSEAAIPTNASSTEDIPDRANPVEATPTDSTPIAVKTKAGRFGGVADVVASRRRAPTAAATVDNIPVATPSAVKTKADNLARVGAGSTSGSDDGADTSVRARAGDSSKARTKAYRIKTNAGGSDPTENAVRHGIPGRRSSQGITDNK